MGDSRAHRFKIRARLEGAIVPVQSGVVIFGREGPPVASIDLAPTPQIVRILPKTLLEIFFWDPFDQDWHLLFSGETIGRGRTKTERSRGFTVRAEGFSNYWYRAYLYMLNGGSSGLIFGNDVSFLGSGAQQVYTSNQQSDDIASLLTGEIEQSFRKILSRVGEVNEFYANAYDRLKIMNRLKVLPDPNVVKLFESRDHFSEVWGPLVKNQTSSASPIIRLVSGLSQLLYYDWVEIPTPASFGAQIIFKPKTYFCPVPRCNVFFPGRYQGLTETRSWMEEPTRLVLQTTIGLNANSRTASGLKLAPSELQDRLDALLADAGGDRQSPEFKEGLDELFRVPMTAEEKIKGILPDYVNLSNSEWNLAAEAGQAWTKNLLDYKFFLAKFQSRMVEVNHSFNPWVVAGFPGAVLDGMGNVFGVVEGVAHAFSRRTGGSTNITMSYTMNPEDDDIPGPGAFPELPIWFNPEYGTGSAYSTLLGSESVGGSAEECAGILQEHYDRFAKSRDLDYTFQTNRRPVITEREYYAALGAAGDGKDVQVYSGGPFRSSNQAPIQAYLQFLGRKVGLTGF